MAGGGFGGLLAAARLREAGASRIRVVEAGGDVGGIWYWNCYAGAACDIVSYIYLPLLEETGYMPRERYSKAPELREHCRIATHFGLYEDALFSTQVTSFDWDMDAPVWQVHIDRGDLIRARFVVLATGLLNKPKLAAILGLGSFRGQNFHTSRWVYAYTGGSATEPMAGLADKLTTAGLRIDRCRHYREALHLPGSKRSICYRDSQIHTRLCRPVSQDARDHSRCGALRGC